jgi:hypothetical protein
MPSEIYRKDMPILIKHFKGVEGKILKIVLRANLPFETNQQS